MRTERAAIGKGSIAETRQVAKESDVSSLRWRKQKPRSPKQKLGQSFLRPEECETVEEVFGAKVQRTAKVEGERILGLGE